MPQADSVALPKRLPLVLQPENRDESTDKDAKLVNGYMERSSNNESEYWIYKRPGLLQVGDTQTGAGRRRVAPLAPPRGQRGTAARRGRRRR